MTQPGLHVTVPVPAVPVLVPRTIPPPPPSGEGRTPTGSCCVCELSGEAPSLAISDVRFIEDFSLTDDTYTWFTLWFTPSLTAIPGDSEGRRRPTSRPGRSAAPPSPRAGRTTVIIHRPNQTQGYIWNFESIHVYTENIHMYKYLHVYIGVGHVSIWG